MLIWTTLDDACQLDNITPPLREETPSNLLPLPSRVQGEPDTMTKYQGKIQLLLSLPVAVEHTVSCKSKFPFLGKMTTVRY